MTWGKEPQGPVGPSEVWKELVRPGQMGPSALLPWATCKPCWSQPGPAQAAGRRAVRALPVMCHTPCHGPGWRREAAGRGSRRQSRAVARGMAPSPETGVWRPVPASVASGSGRLLSES